MFENLKYSSDHAQRKSRQTILWNEVKIICMEQHWRIKRVKKSAYILYSANFIGRRSIDINSLQVLLIRRDNMIVCRQMGDIIFFLTGRIIIFYLTWSKMKAGQKVFISLFFFHATYCYLNHHIENVAIVCVINNTALSLGWWYC